MEKGEMQLLERQTEISNQFDPPKRFYSEHALTRAWRKGSYVWATILLAFALVVVYYQMGQDWTNPPWGPDKSPVWINIVIFTLLLFWIMLLEGAHVSIVGLSSVDIETFKDTHPQSYTVCKWAHKGPNLERFIVGRQFLLLFIVFMVSRLGGSDGSDLENTGGRYFFIGEWEWSATADVIFIQNNVLLMIVIIVPGHLVSQLIAAGKMLDFLELPFAPIHTVMYPSMAFETLGLTHCCYALRDLFLRWAKLPPISGAKAHRKNWLYHARVLMSVCVVIFASVFIVKGLFAEQTGATNGVGWNKLPGVGAFFVCIFFLFFIGCCEGFQIAAVTLAKVPSSELRTKYPVAYRTALMLYTGRNLQAFLVGRQVFVAMLMVLLAKATGYAGTDGDLVTGSDWGMGRRFNEALLQTGILGAIFVVNVGQLSFRMAATAFPILFINNYVMYALLRVALLVEMTGAFNSCWVLAWAVDHTLRLQHDPFDGEENIKSPAQVVLDRKESMGIPSPKGVSPFEFFQPERDATTYAFEVSYI
eukprot:m.474091 g.474091  ORF g.474091 m.474091 type:complete len:532 (+) comp21670_c3_seq32:168-1763(+)